MKKTFTLAHWRKSTFNFKLFFALFCLLGLTNFDTFANLYSLKINTKKNNSTESNYRACTIDLAIRGVLRINCANPTTVLTATSSVPGVTFNWTGPSGFVSNIPNPTISIPGYYVVVATNPATGCTAKDSAFVNQNFVKPNVVGTGGTITCANPTVTLKSLPNNPTVTFAWTGPGGFTSNLPNPVVAVGGVYTVTGTASNGCSASDTAVVKAITTIPDVVATVSGIITCTNPNVTLVATSATPGATFAWTGPGGYTSNTAISIVSAAGTYTVKVTDQSNGCVSTASVTVLQNTSVPAFTIVGRRRLNCANPTTVLTANTSTAGAIFSWTGPGGFTSNLPNPTISGGGLYNLTVTNPVNGCAKSDTAFVNQNFIAPPITTTGGSITCVNSTVTITASSSNLSTIFTWTGPGGFTATGPSASVSVPGVYTVSGIAGNGCTNTATATVNINTTAPDVIATGGTITCANSSVTLSVSSATPAATFAWTGPGGFTSNDPNPVVAAVGTYVVTATDPANGCTAFTFVNVDENTTPPAIAVTGATITCSTAPVIITAQSPLPTVDFSWTGPGGFTANIPNPVVTVPGTYNVTATNISTGCVSAASVVVLQNTTTPTFTITGRRRLNCANPTTVLTANTSTAGAIFSWTGPGGFTSNLPNPTISGGGLYNLTVTNPVNGCAKSDTAFVNQNFIAPPITTTGGSITCVNSTVTITASSSNLSTIFTWTGPGGFTATGPSASVSVPGVYTVSGIAGNGCTNTATATVNINTTAPDVIATGGTITCANSSVTLSVSSATPAATFAWTGPGGFTSNDPNPVVAAVGTYVVTATDPANGCTAFTFVNVDENTTPPAIAVTGATITCSTAPVIITAQSPLPTVDFSWTGPGGFTANIPNPVVTVPGTYNVTATNISTGCVSAASVVVLQNTTTPTFTIVGRRRLNCANPTTVLTANTSTVGAIFSWTGPGGFTSNLPNPTISGGGLYNLTVIDPISGCAKSDTAFVNQNFTAPPITTTGGAITCANSTVVITASSSNLSTVFTWTGPGGFTATGPSALVSAPGVYTVSGIAGNGCTNTATATVSINTTIPNLTATGGTITCTNSTVILVASSTTPLTTFVWTGPGGFTSNLPNPTVSALGTYTVTATNPASGCTKAISVQVNENKTVPVCSIQAQTLTPKAGSTQNLAGTSATNTAYSWSLLSSSPLWKIVGSTTNSSAQITVGPVGTQATFILVVTNKLSGCKQTCQITLTAIASHNSLVRDESNESDENSNLYTLTYANPLSEHNSLTFSTSDNSKAKIELYTSTTGKKVETLFENNTRKDEKYNLSLNGKNMSSGLYIIRLTINHKVFREKIILKR